MITGEKEAKERQIRYAKYLIYIAETLVKNDFKTTIDIGLSRKQIIQEIIYRLKEASEIIKRIY